MADNTHHSGVKKQSRVLLCVSLIVLLIGLWQTFQNGRLVEAHQREKLLMKAATIARTISPDHAKVLSFTAADKDSPVFQRLRLQLVAVAERFDLNSLYTLAQRNGDLYFGPESLAATNPAASPPGTLYRRAPPEAAAAFGTRLPQSTGVYTDEYGTFVSAFVPVLDPRTGEALLVVAIDIRAETWQSKITEARRIPFLITLALLSILILSHLVLANRRRLQTRSPRQRRYAEATLGALVMLTLTGAAVWYANAAERQARLAVFSSLAHAQASVIAKELRDLRETSDSMRRFYQASEFVDADNFHAFSERYIQANPTRACLWLPQVASQHVSRVERDAQHLGFNRFSVWQHDESGCRVAARGRETFFPILLIEPFKGQEAVQGFDLTSHPSCRKAIDDALRCGLATASTPVTLRECTNASPCVYIFQPAASARQKGLAALMFRMDTLIMTPHYKTGSLTTGLAADIFQCEAGQPPLFLASSDPTEQLSEPVFWPVKSKHLRIRVPVFCFGKVYAIVIRTTPDWLIQHPLCEGRSTALAGLLVTLLLTALVALISNRRLALERGIQNRFNALRQAEQLYQTLFNEMHYGFILFEVINDDKGRPCDYRFLSINPAFERITQIEALPLIGMTVSQIPFQADPNWKQIYLKVAVSGEPEPFNLFIQQANRHIEGTIFRPNMSHLACIFSDVTARKRAEEKVQAAAVESSRLLAEAEQAQVVLLRAAEEQKRTDDALVHERNLLYALMDNLPDGIFFKDKYSRYIKISKAHAVSLGLTDPADAIGKSDSDFHAGEAVERESATERRIIETGQPLLAQISQTQTADGKVKWVSTSKVPICDTGSRVIGLVGISRDITQEIELQAQLQHASKMDAIGQLAGGVAHDFNNLLQAIMGFTEILLSGTREQDSQYRDLKQIERAAKRAADLTRQLLAFSRKQLIEPRIVDINVLVSTMETMLCRLMGEDVEIVLQLAPDLRPVLADPGQMEQIIMNLAINARDAMARGGRLTFATRNSTLNSDDVAAIPESRPGTFMCLSVSDTGTGIPQELISRIFEPFFTTKGQGKGTGLGLAVIYGIVKQNGGWINVVSQVGQGTTFNVFLPSQDQHAENAAPRPSAKAPLTLPGLGKSILLVEDEPGVLSLASLVLRSAGYRVVSCENAQAAHAAFDRAEGRFDLLFSDVVLPGQNGIELATELHSKQPNLPVLLCSGYADDRVRWALIEQQGFHFMPKPYPTELLLQSVSEALELPQLPVA